MGADARSPDDEGDALVALAFSRERIQGLAGTLNGAIAAFKATGERSPVRAEREAAVRAALAPLVQVLGNYAALAAEKLPVDFATPHVEWARDTRERAKTAAARALGEGRGEGGG